MERFLFRQIDNTPLVVFRIIFGLLLFLESWGAILTGWVTKTLVEPKFTFNFIGFDFLQPLPGNGMYYYYIVMGIFGFYVMIGYRYRVAMTSFFLLWSATYLMQKSSYNNHYYLTALLSFIMIFLPANTYQSIDAKRNPTIKSYSVPYWTSVILMIQIGIVYFYGGVAKMYPDWLQGIPTKIFLKSKTDYPIIGGLLKQDWFPYFLSYGGLLFDLLIVPLLLFKRTRFFAFCVSAFFHLFNAAVFQVGIFPFLTLSFAVFFFDARKVHQIFLKKKPFYDKNEIKTPSNRNLTIGFFGLYVLIQVLLPLRHWAIEDDVLWTEEGHRLSWRMMLRAKHGYQTFTVVDKKTNEKEVINLNDYVTSKQKYPLGSKPDFIWQFAQRLKKEYAKQGKDIAVYASGRMSVNGKEYKPLINDTIDIASVKWHHFKHNDWILSSKNNAK